MVWVGDSDLLRQTPLFRDLSGDEWDRLHPRFRMRTYYEDEVVIEEGRSVQSLVVIRTGCLKVSKPAGPEGERVLAYLSDGDYVGEMSLLKADHRATADVSAQMETDVWEIYHSQLMEAMGASAPLAAKFYKAFCHLLSERLQRLNEAYAALPRSPQHESPTAHAATGRDLHAAQTRRLSGGTLSHPTVAADEIRRRLSRFPRG